MNYYNENDSRAAAWLRELIKSNLIPDGKIDERSILEVHHSDLAGFGQCHFFAGIGGWCRALYLCGLTEAKSIWTISCPCQPFSCAGTRMGEADERHLWPYARNLIGHCQPAIVFGEQVASPLGLQWLDGVQADMERAAYAFGCADLCAASVGAPHIRQRAWWVAESQGDERSLGIRDCYSARSARLATVCKSGGVGEPIQPGLEGQSGHGHNGNQPGRLGAESDGPITETSCWSAFDIVPCRDGKSRRVERGTFPLAYGIPGRVGILRGYGNAIVPDLAAQFIQAYLEASAAINGNNSL